MKTIPRIILASLFAAGAAIAAPITGSINIVSFADSAFTFNTVANTVTFGAGNNALVSNASAGGSYVSLIGASVHYTSFTYDPLTPSPVSPLWITTSGGPLSSFTLTSIATIVEIPGTSLTLTGSGVASVAGLDNTVGNWSFTATQNGTTFGWDSINTQRVPDSGATMALLGLSVLGLGGVRRFLPSLKK